MVVGDVDAWWIPDIKVAEYFFKKNISEIENFSNKNYHDRSLEKEFEYSDSVDYISLDENFEFTVKNNEIISITCNSYFYINTKNIIGKNIKFLQNELKKRFFVKDILVVFDSISVEYDDGDIQTDVSVDEFSIFATVDETNSILSLSVISP